MAGLDARLVIAANAFSVWITFVGVSAATCSIIAAGRHRITELSLAVLVFGGCRAAPNPRAHATPLFDGFLHGAARRVKELAVDLAGVVACGVLAWRLWLQAGITDGLHTQSQVLHVPMAPVVYFMALTSAISTVVLVLRIGRSLRDMATGVAARP